MLAEPHGDRAATLLWAESERSRFARASADLHRRSEALAVLRGAADTRTPADWVEPLIDSHTSRWIFFSSASRPFGMVNLSPDTRTDGDWMNGYLYGDAKVRYFSQPPENASLRRCAGPLVRSRHESPTLTMPLP